MQKYPFKTSWEYNDKMFVVPNCLNHTIKTQPLPPQAKSIYITFADYRLLFVMHISVWISVMGCFWCYPYQISV